MDDEPWIERKQGDSKPDLKRGAMVQVEYRNGRVARSIVALVDWRWLNISSDVVKYRQAPQEVRPQGQETES